MAVNYTNGRYNYSGGTATDPAAASKERNRLAEEDRVRRNAAAYNSPVAGDYMSSHGGQAASMLTDTRNSYDTAIGNGNGSSGSGGRLSQAQQNWNSALDMTQGRGDATMNDPRVGAALDLLQQHTKEGPYTGAVVNQQANRMADRTSAMAGNQAEALRTRAANSGGNVNDPSYQAAINQADTGRMQQNNADRGDLETQATLNNYREQGNAAGQLGSMRMGQLGMANNQYNQASQLYANQQQTSGHSNALSNGNQGQPQKLGYQTPQYNPQDWSAIIDAINNTGGNSGDNTPAAPAQNARPAPSTPWSESAFTPQEYAQAGKTQQQWQQDSGQSGANGNSFGNWWNEPSSTAQAGNDASDYTGQAAQNWAADKGTRNMTLKPVAGTKMPYTYNPSDMR